MNVALYTVDFRADVYFGTKLKSEHRIVLTAEDSKDAEDRARWFFQQHGGWTRTANLTGRELLSEPRIRDFKVVEVQRVVAYERQLLIDEQIPRKR